MRRLVLLAVLLTLSAPVLAAEQTFRGDGVVVTSTGISGPYAAAIGRTVGTARAAALALGYDMPATIHVRVACGPEQQTRLFNDGQDRFSLSIGSENDLRKPAVTGIFHLYGLCHEVGHLAQYRPVTNHDWMTTAAAEGWAHYLGSLLVDAVYAKDGATLWPDAYDYRVDGMARLKRQLAGRNPSDTAKGAGLWMELVEALDHKAVAALFKAWGQTRVNPSDPGPALGNMVRLAGQGKPQVAAWWKKAEPVLVLRREGSRFAVETVSPSDLSGHPVTLKHDDGAKAGHKSLAGSGHAVRFQMPSGKWYLRGVMIHGSRYGGSRPPEENFHVWLCDKDFRAIADFPFPYKVFERGEAKWVPLPMAEPTLVPADFIICVGFNPTGTKGVFVSQDKGGSANTLAGLPGKSLSSFGGGDWMIRAVVDRPKTARGR